MKLLVKVFGASVFDFICIYGAATIVTAISLLRKLPVKIVMSTYAIAPIPIPFAIEYVSGIIMSVRNAGTALLISFISTVAKFFIINTPT